MERARRKNEAKSGQRKDAAVALAAPDGEDENEYLKRSPPRELLRFVTIEDGIDVDVNGNPEMTPTLFGQILAGIQGQQNVIEGILASSGDVTCIVSDMFFPWMQNVADKFHIPRVVLWSGNATYFHLLSMARAHQIYPGSPIVEELGTKLHVDQRRLLEDYYYNTPPELPILDRIEEAACVLINTCDALEGALLPDISPMAKYIGPCFQNTGDGAENASLLEEDKECMKWLEGQEDKSVVYISFGSVGYLPPKKIEEVALGVEASMKAFIWVAKRRSFEFPRGFLERTRERGKIVEWAPQVQVLGHRAVGLFITHCGWNSTGEFVYGGAYALLTHLW